ncbi:MAG: DUF1326 domain-containing protein [Deferrisomatales bacterium]|nr:DUF1326 domain-containing protein [Deferrisomatales bacterium]
MTETAVAPWHAEGLLFENCSCTLVCPGHVHFSQGCTLDRCVGYWAVRFDAGEIDGVDLAGAKAVVAFDSPQHMIEGGWTQVLVLDPAGAEAQRAQVERILRGEAGGPWAVLGRFVGERRPTILAPIVIEDEGRVKKVRVEGLLDARVEAIRGRDKGREVTFENMFNQIHPPSQVLALGSTVFDDGEIRIGTKDSHALYSHFTWRVG